MKSILPYIIIIDCIGLILVILLQNQSSSLGSGFGGETNFYRSKRGVERILFGATIVLAIILVSSILATLLIK